jgi:TIR domain-containing protein
MPMNFGDGTQRRHKAVWLAIAAIVVAGIAAALAPSPSGLADTDTRAASTFAALASAAIVAVSVLPFIVLRGAGRRAIWLTLAVAALALGVGSFSAGGYAQRACTARYGEKPIVIGTELTTLGATYKRANPSLSSDELLFDAAGVPGRIWTRSSIDACRTFISSTYFLWIPFLVVCLLAAVQAMPAAGLPGVLRDAPAPQAPGGADAPARYDVFISYRHGGRDTEVATQLAEALEADGYAVAIDERDFPANAGFLPEMERCVRESRATVAVISPRYLESGNCQEEAIICKVLDMGDRKRRLIPLVIEPVSMPAWLYGIVGIDCTKANPLVDPFDKLKSTLGAPLANAAGVRLNAELAKPAE